VGRCLYKALGSDQEIAPRTIATTPPAIEISTPREIIVTFPHPPLFPHDGFCLGVDVKPSSLLSWGTPASPPRGSCSCSSLTPAHEVRFSPIPRTCFAPRLAFARSESFSLRSRSALRCRTLGRSRPRLAGLVPLMGKASVSNITVPLGFVVVPKALAMARLSAAASLLAILPLSSSRFCPLAPYCYHPPLGWHPTAHHRLAPYCYSPAGTLLLLTGWHPTAHRRWLASPLPGGSARLPTSLPPAIYSTVANLA